jgi:hypothetical protein
MTMTEKGELVHGLMVVLEGLRLMELDDPQSHRGCLYIREIIRMEWDHLDRLDHRVLVVSPWSNSPSIRGDNFSQKFQSRLENTLT